MLQMLKQIFSVGTVTEKYDSPKAVEGLYGEICPERKNCLSCHACIRCCPVGALSFNAESVLEWERRKCIFCGSCLQACRSEALTQSGKLATPEVAFSPEGGSELRRRITAVLGRSLHIRHLDAGSCNACDFEMAALNGPYYDLQQYGIDFVASPRHADLLMVSGVVTRNLKQALLMTYEATPTPRLVMAVGACASSGAVFPASYAQLGAVDDFLPVDVYVPGCPPSPAALLQGLFMVLEKI